MPWGKASCRLPRDGLPWTEGETAAKSLPCSLGHCVLPSLPLSPLELLVLCAPTLPSGRSVGPLCPRIILPVGRNPSSRRMGNLHFSMATGVGNEAGPRNRGCVKRQHRVCWPRARPSHLAASVCLGTASTGDPEPGTGRGCWPHCPAVPVGWVSDAGTWPGGGSVLLDGVGTRSIPTCRFPLSAPRITGDGGV